MEYLPTLIEELGGGADALLIIGLAWALYRERQRNDDLHAKRAEEAGATREAEIKRQVDMTVTLQRMADLLERMNRGGTS